MEKRSGSEHIWQIGLVHIASSLVSLNSDPLKKYLRELGFFQHMINNLSFIPW